MFNRINELALESNQGRSSCTRVAQSNPPPEVGEQQNVLSTPNSSSIKLQPPPPPVPALRIVKRSRLIPRMSTSTTATNNSRRTSSVPAVPAAIIPISGSTVRQSPPKLGPRIGKKTLDVPKSVMEAKRTDPASSFRNMPVAGNGPRRVLIPEGPKFNPNSDQARSFSTVSGPRRVAVAKPTIERAPRLTKPDASGLKQPGTYTSIPKPVSREAGSRLPAPQGSKQRLGVLPGLQGRRFT